MVVETRLRKLEEKIERNHAEVIRLLMGRNILGNWVSQKIACATLNVKPRQLQNIRIHLDKDNKTVGSIRWRKGQGKSVQYHKADIEKYLSKITVQ